MLKHNFGAEQVLWSLFMGLIQGMFMFSLLIHIVADIKFSRNVKV